MLCQIARAIRNPPVISLYIVIVCMRYPPDQLHVVHVTSAWYSAWCGGVHHPPSACALCAASAAMRLLGQMPDIAQLRDIDSLPEQTAAMTQQDLRGGFAWFEASLPAADGEGVKHAVEAVRLFGPYGIITKAPKGAAGTARPRCRPADAKTRLQVRIGRSGMAHSTGRVLLQNPFTLSVSEAGVSYMRLDRGISFIRGTEKHPTVDIRFLQVVRDAGELLLKQAWQQPVVAKPTIHVTTALLLQHLGLAGSHAGTSAADITRMGQLLTLFVWAMTHCVHGEIKALRPELPHAWHRSCATAVARGWELLHFCLRSSWRDADAASSGFMSVLACIPRHILEAAGEEFDSGLFDGFLQDTKIRQPHHDTSEPRTPPKV